LSGDHFLNPTVIVCFILRTHFSKWPITNQLQ